MITPTGLGFRVCLTMFGLVLITMASSANGETGENSEGDASTPPFRLVTPERDRNFRSHLPVVNDSEIQQLLDDPRLILYSEREMPRAHQDWDGALKGVHWSFYNISADRSEPFGNANREFPWGHPAGTHRCGNVQTFRFFWLPQDESGQMLPVTWYQQQFRGDVRYGYAWIFPIGTVFGEVLQLASSDGKHHTFELRVRKREVGEWSINVFRPFPSAHDLAQRIKQLRPEWQNEPKLLALVGHLESPIELTKGRLVNSHPRRAIDQTLGVDQLPEVGDEKLVAELLSTTEFQSVIDGVWRQDANELWTSAPTTSADFHIVPANYDAGFIAIDRESCIRCHDTTAMHVRDFQFGRDWYGRVRGSDGIFSFHPFDPSCISTNGFGGGVTINAHMVNAGILAKFDAQKHPKEYYTRIPKLDR